MAELNAVHRRAFFAGDYGTVVATIRQKCKISGLEVDPRANAQDPFETATDEELDEEIEKTQRELRQCAVGKRGR